MKYIVYASFKAISSKASSAVPLAILPVELSACSANLFGKDLRFWMTTAQRHCHRALQVYPKTKE